MNKKHIISLAGDLASGKGAVSKELADRLNYEIYRNGEYFRKLAKEHNKTAREIEKGLFAFNRMVLDKDLTNLYSWKQKNFVKVLETLTKCIEV